MIICYKKTYKLYLNLNPTHPSQEPSKHIKVELTLIVNVYQRCFNVDFWLKIKVESTYVYRRCFNVYETTLLEVRCLNVYNPTVLQR